mgnify:FL=1
MQIDYETERELGIDYETLAVKVADKVLEMEKCPYDAQVNLVLTDNEEIERVNTEFRDIARPTDVLSFPMIPFETPAGYDIVEEDESYFDLDTDELLLGDIMISVDKVFAQAEEYGHSVTREFCFLVAHSMLHLLGYDHMTPGEAAVMEAKQAKAWRSLGLHADLQILLLQAISDGFCLVTVKTLNSYKNIFIWSNKKMNYRERLKDKKRIVIKIGSSSLTHSETGRLNLRKLEVLARELSDLRNQGKDVILVSSGAIATGVAALGMHEKPTELKGKQACAAVGQARLMMIYQKLFSEYNQLSAQILMTKNTMVNNVNRKNAQNTFNELLSLGVIPIVNENDSISTYELQNLEKFGDNDTLSAMVAALVRADLLILLSDIDGLFTDDPNTNPDAKFIDVVENLDDNLLNMGKGTSGSKVGTGGMATKLTAAQIASAAGVDMVIANGADFHIIHKITEGRKYGTLFVSQSKEEVYLIDIIDRLL